MDGWSTACPFPHITIIIIPSSISDNTTHSTLELCQHSSFIHSFVQSEQKRTGKVLIYFYDSGNNTTPGTTSSILHTPFPIHQRHRQYTVPYVLNSHLPNWKDIHPCLTECVGGWFYSEWVMGWREKSHFCSFVHGHFHFATSPLEMFLLLLCSLCLCCLVVGLCIGRRGGGLRGSPWKAELRNGPHQMMIKMLSRRGNLYVQLSN